MEVTLPYSPQEKFGVPDNVYILGTMNTADRSIALIDTALRRRFSFIEYPPEPDVLKEITLISGQELNISEMLATINMRIEYLYDREHRIGHAFFVGLRKEPTISKLASIFKNSVIPLLQEYFYEDYQKIQFVLGDNAKDDSIKFIIDIPIDLTHVFKGNVEEYVDEKKAEYKINEDAFTNIEAYRQIM
jgi:5-methylcytosine-specific restriction protein B